MLSSGKKYHLLFSQILAPLTCPDQGLEKPLCDPSEPFLPLTTAVQPLSNLKNHGKKAADSLFFAVLSRCLDPNYIPVNSDLQATSPCGGHTHGPCSHGLLRILLNQCLALFI